MAGLCKPPPENSAKDAKALCLLKLIEDRLAGARTTLENTRARVEASKTLITRIDAAKRH
jgi:hypothetical protein